MPSQFCYRMKRAWKFHELSILSNVDLLHTIMLPFLLFVIILKDFFFFSIFVYLPSIVNLPNLYNRFISQINPVVSQEILRCFPFLFMYFFIALALPIDLRPAKYVHVYKKDKHVDQILWLYGAVYNRQPVSMCPNVVIFFTASSKGLNPFLLLVMQAWT